MSSTYLLLKYSWSLVPSSSGRSLLTQSFRGCSHRHWTQNQIHTQTFRSLDFLLGKRSLQYLVLYFQIQSFINCILVFVGSLRCRCLDFSFSAFLNWNNVRSFPLWLWQKIARTDEQRHKEVWCHEGRKSEPNP